VHERETSDALYALVQSEHKRSQMLSISRPTAGSHK